MENQQTPSPSKKPRKFAVEPVETSTRSSRKFAPQPVETTTRHGGGNGKEKEHSPSSQALADMSNGQERRRFAPQPVETVTRSNKKLGNADSQMVQDEGTSALQHELSPSEVKVGENATKRPTRRKFAPQLIETAKRSRKSGDTVPALLPGDKTNVSPGDVVRPNNNRPGPCPMPPSNTPWSSQYHVPQLHGPPSPRRQPSIRPLYPTRYNTRQHSYAIPDLDRIDSSESEASDAPSLSHSESRNSDTSNEAYKDATRLRESVDDRFSGYLLDLAARAAEKQLREQAASAFANSDYHEGIAHYMDRSGSDENLSEMRVDLHGHVKTRARTDSEDEKWALKDMQRHGENRSKQQSGKTGTKAFNLEFDDDAKQDAWLPPSAQGFVTSKPPKKLIGGKQLDDGLKEMRKAASPPMLGDEIDFPRCASPDHARFDVTQGSEFLKSMCYLTDQANESSGLWCMKNAQESELEPVASESSHGTCGGGTWAAMPKSPTPQADGGNSLEKLPSPAGAGLWGGFCTDLDKLAIPPPFGLVTPVRTPNNECEDPFASLSAVTTALNFDSTAIAGPRAAIHAPPSPPTSSKGSNVSASIRERLEIEEQIDKEFPDAVVTQVYNYLSIGYPSIAKRFDEELGKISHIAVHELRQDDKLAEVRGYIRLGFDEVDIAAEEAGLEVRKESEIINESMCMRWKALRAYIREWGRQTIVREREGGSAMRPDPHRAWGLTARKGSWGF